MSRYFSHLKLFILFIGISALVVGLAGCAPAGQVTPSASPSAPVASPSASVESGTPSPNATEGTPGATPTVGTPSPTGTVTGTSTPGTGTPVARQPGCDNLESVLYNLTQAPDPVSYASQHQLYYKQGKVRVVIVLNYATDDIPPGYDLTVETRQDNTVQALVPVRDLCRLSNEPQVRYVRAPIEFSR